MALDPYSSCPCGSGKKFKWCCQPVHVQITKAFQQDKDRQHEAALRTMETLAAEHSGNPEVWGRMAQLLYERDKMEEAEAALQKAFALNPDYPFGHLLQGKFRLYEGEIAGAMMLFRKAAHLYDPEARSILAQIQALIADCELKLNRPVAARAALQLAVRLAPDVEEYRQGLEQIFGETAGLPLVARKEYQYQRLADSAGNQKRAAWDRGLAAAASGKLADAAKAFQQLVQEDEENPAAWYNLGLTRAWEGDNWAALEAFERFVSLEPDEGKAAAAWALAEVLRCGQGLEDQADYVTHFVILGLRDPQLFMNVLAELEQQRRLAGVRVRQEEGLLNCMILEKVRALTPQQEAQTAPKLAAFLLMAGPVVRLWNVNRETLERLVQELKERMGPALARQEWGRGPSHFNDIVSEWLIFPFVEDQAEARRCVGEGCARFLEETWIHRPLAGLARVSPLDAAGHANLRKKLLGIIQFLEECGQMQSIPCDFDRLRRQLDLLGPAASPMGTAQPDISSLSASELASLVPENLTGEQANQAYQSALKLDARELAGRFAQNLISRPPQGDHLDRYPWYGHLVQLSLAEGNTEAALAFISEGEKADGRENEGRHRNDYDLRRGQILARRGEIQQAQDVFDGLIARMPAESRFRGSAAEAMLSAKDPARALRFARQGLDLARKQNDRDSEGYFLELVAAAQK